jgi:hypothetical protein
MSSKPPSTKEEIAQAEKAEFWQSVSALYIPFGLFIACVIFSGGVFLIYYNEPAGWFFIATTAIIAITAFIALFRFQNKYRAKGIVPGDEVILESTTIDASPEAGKARIAAPKAAIKEVEQADTIEKEAKAKAEKVSS